MVDICLKYSRILVSWKIILSISSLVDSDGIEDRIEVKVRLDGIEERVGVEVRLDRMKVKIEVRLDKIEVRVEVRVGLDRIEERIDGIGDKRASNEEIGIDSRVVDVIKLRGFCEIVLSNRLLFTRVAKKMDIVT